MRYIFILIFILFFSSCSIVPPEVEWKDISSDHDPLLNILGIISSDSLVTSFVQVHRTLDLEEAQDTLVRDTVNGLINIYYASRFVVRNAEVIVYRDDKEYQFDYSNIYMEDRYEISMGAYFYNGDDLNPQPGEVYTLSVTTPSGHYVTGQTIIPPRSNLHKEVLPDTFQINQDLQINWDPLVNHNQLINVGNYLSLINDFYYYGYYYERGVCGINQERLISPGENNWTYHREFCDENNFSEQDWGEDWLLLQLMSMDQNYYDFFIKYSQEDQEYSNLFIGQGGSGRNYGVEGGIGIFGSVIFDRTFIRLVP
ncbi:MAG: hypothetical protein CMG74_11480 [Candidatus Marinimicrobia bacterium]|nr:hypothetical protein [Candidatus Neomarinimicrobiota bacterium]